MLNSVCQQVSPLTALTCYVCLVFVWLNLSLQLYYSQRRPAEVYFHLVGFPYTTMQYEFKTRSKKDCPF